MIAMFGIHLGKKADFPGQCRATSTIAPGGAFVIKILRKEVLKKDKDFVEPNLKSKKGG